MIVVPRIRLIALGILVAAYPIVLFFASFDRYARPAPAIVGLVLYVLAAGISLLPWRGRMPIWMACFNLAVTVALCLLIPTGLDSTENNDYATWHVLAIGGLMVITLVRGRGVLAWTGVAIVAVLTVAWAGIGSVGSLGVIGSVVWVGVADLSSRGINRASRDVRGFERAERAAALVQAAKEAQSVERDSRLASTARTAEPMLQRIVDSHGQLNDADRDECVVLEAGLRDEIRGRAILDDPVRAAIKAARNRGTNVSVLDDGGLDDLAPEDLERIRGIIADAVQSTITDRLVIRTQPNSELVAVTIVGTSSEDSSAVALGTASEDQRVDIWVEVPRELAREPVA